MDIAAIRAQFPGLQQLVHGKRFAYLDSGATAQKPHAVIERMNHFLREEYGTVHRGLYQRSVASTEAYEQARHRVAQFFGAQTDEMIFTMGTTDGINLVAWTWGRKYLKAGDQVLVTGMEHHANIVPWQILSEITGCELIACPMHDDGSLDRDAFSSLLTERVKLVSLIHIANALGTINPIEALITEAHTNGSRVLVDAAQSAPHMPLDVKQLDCDFLVCSAHKCYGPTGIGALYGKAEVLADMPPWRGGGEMIDKVSFTGTTFADPPLRFEAGTPPIVEAIGFAAALDWMSDIGLTNISSHERDLFSYTESKLAEVPGLNRIGTAPQRSTAISFTMGDAHPADIASILDMEGVAIRAGHHCAQPVMDRFKVSATARISFGVYNDEQDIDQAVAALQKVSELFGLSATA